MSDNGHNPGMEQSVSCRDSLGRIAPVIGSHQSQGICYATDIDAAGGIRLIDRQLDGVGLRPAYNTRACEMRGHAMVITGLLLRLAALFPVGSEANGGCASLWASARMGNNSNNAARVTARLTGTSHG